MYRDAEGIGCLQVNERTALLGRRSLVVPPPLDSGLSYLYVTILS